MTTTEAPVEATCEACGQTDTHPMIHIAYAVWQKNDRTTIVEPSFHFDCLPDEYRQGLYVDGEAAPQHAVTVAAIEAAESGTKGDALRKFILKQEPDNDVSTETKES